MIISSAFEEMIEILLLCFNITSKEHTIFNKKKKDNRVKYLKQMTLAGSFQQ